MLKWPWQHDYHDLFNIIITSQLSIFPILVTVYYTSINNSHWGWLPSPSNMDTWDNSKAKGREQPVLCIIHDRSLSYSSERTCINLCSTQRAIINIQQTAVWTAPKISYATRTCVWLVIKMLDLQPHIWLGKDTKPLGALHCWSEFASVFVFCCQIVIMYTLNLFISAWPSFRKSNIIHWIYFVKLKVF